MHDFVEFKLPGFLLVVYYAAMLVLGDAHRDRILALVEAEVFGGEVRGRSGANDNLNLLFIWHFEKTKNI